MAGITRRNDALRWAWFCAFSPDGKTMASVGLDNVVRVWDITSRKQIAEVTGHRRRIHFVTFSHDGRQLTTAGMDRTVRRWNTPTPTQANRTSEGGGSGGGGVRAACRAESEKLCAGEERVGQMPARRWVSFSAECRPRSVAGEANK